MGARGPQHCLGGCETDPGWGLGFSAGEPDQREIWPGCGPSWAISVGAEAPREDFSRFHVSSVDRVATLPAYFSLVQSWGVCTYAGRLSSAALPCSCQASAAALLFLILAFYLASVVLGRLWRALVLCISLGWPLPLRVYHPASTAMPFDRLSALPSSLADSWAECFRALQPAAFQPTACLPVELVALGRRPVALLRFALSCHRARLFVCACGLSLRRAKAPWFLAAASPPC